MVMFAEFQFIRNVIICLIFSMTYRIVPVVTSYRIRLQKLTMLQNLYKMSYGFAK